MVVRDLIASSQSEPIDKNVEMVRTLIRFLQSMQTLKTYESEKSKLLHQTQDGNDQVDATNSSIKDSLSFESQALQPDHSVQSPDNTVGFVEKRDYSEYLKKLNSVNYRRPEAIREYVHEIKAH